MSNSFACPTGKSLGTRKKFLILLCFMNRVHSCVKQNIGELLRWGVTSKDLRLMGHI